jgi:TB2/DP1, HVA22 family
MTPLTPRPQGDQTDNSSITAFLFPIFASYKALKANDQTQLTPWLMYWVVIACIVVVENFLGWFLNLYLVCVFI